MMLVLCLQVMDILQTSRSACGCNSDKYEREDMRRMEETDQNKQN